MPATAAEYYVDLSFMIGKEASYGFWRYEQHDDKELAYKDSTFPAVFIIRESAYGYDRQINISGTCEPGTVGKIYQIRFFIGDSYDSTLRATVTKGPQTIAVSKSSIEIQNGTTETIDKDGTLRVFTKNGNNREITHITDKPTPEVVFGTAGIASYNNGVITGTKQGTTTVRITSAATDSYTEATEFNFTLTVNNTAPRLKNGVNATASANAVRGNSYPVNLADVFEDPDGHDLTYLVDVNNGGYVSASASYAYTPTAAGTQTLMFKANDGIDDSTDTYTVTLTVTNPYIPPSDPKPNGNANTVIAHDQGIDIKIDNVKGDGTPVVIEIRDEDGNVVKTITGVTDADGKLHVDIPGDLPPGKYTLHVSSPGNDMNKGFEAHQIGTLLIRFKPTLTGNNTLVTLRGFLGELGFGATLSGSDPKNPMALTVKLGGKSATFNQTGDGAVQLRCAMDPAASGTVPVTVFAPETPTSEAIPETPIGSVTVASIGSLLSGDLAGKLGEGWSIIEIADGVSIALQGAGLGYDPLDGTVTLKIGEGVKSVINFGGKGSVTARIETVNASRFGQKAAQPVPSKQLLKANGALSKAKKLAMFSFTGQEMARLEPGLYQFSLEAKSTGKLNLATIRVVTAEKVPVSWTIPETLRVSVGQQYQLVKPTADGNVLPELTVKTSNKRVATLTTGGVLTAKRSGAATISVKDKDGGTLKCKLTVVSNSYSRSRPLYIKGKPGLYTSTKRLYYEKGALKAEVFVANATGVTIRGADGFIFELYDGETLVYQRSVGPMTFTLKNKKFGAYKLTITNEMLAGVSTKSFDLGSNRYQAVIRGDNAIPLVSSTKGAVQAKSSTFGSAGTIKPLSTKP